MEEKRLCGVLDDKWNLLRKVGKGGTSSVYIGYDINGSEDIIYAVKVTNSKDRNSKYFINEVEMLKKINHPNVVRILDGGEGLLQKINGKNKFVCYILLEYIQCGELFDFIFFPQQGFGEKYGRLIFTSILDGLEACHYAGVVHRDIKNENIMITENFEIKLADFGFAAIKEGKDGKGLLYTSLGTPSYAAPELHNRLAYYGESNDIFSLAVTLFVLITGAIPFRMATLNDPLYQYIIKNDFETYMSKRGLKMHLSEQFLSLFFNMIAYDYTQRPSIQEIRQHSWMQEVNSNDADGLRNELNDEFKRRREIVDKKRAKEILLKLEEKNNKRILLNRVYRSDNDINDHVEDNIERVLDNYVDYGNKYLISVSKQNNLNDLFKYIHNYFTNLKGDVNLSNDKYEITVLMPADDDKNNLDDDEDNYINMIQFQELKIKIEVKNDNDNYIVQFNKCSGDRLRFYNLFQSFFDSLN